MIVTKFGGSCLSDSKDILKTSQIVKDYLAKDKVVLVVSAMKGVTDQLYDVVSLVKDKKLRKALDIINEIKDRHLETLYVLNSKPEAVKTETELINLVNRLENFVKNVVKKRITAAREDYIVSFGERLSCSLVAEALETRGMLAYPVDASFVIATDGNFGQALPLFKKTQNHIKKILFPLLENSVIPVITGFIGFAPDGCTTTLGRGGSDLSAAYLANLLEAKSLYLWKDVEGFYTSDPKKDKRARLIKKLSYREAEKMAKKGAKVVYYKAIRPVERKGIPIYIKSFINPKTRGTKIGINDG